MGSRTSRIAIPAIGLLAVFTALAIVAFAPLVLFPEGNATAPLPGAPHAAREVARVTAPRPPEHDGIGLAARGRPSSGSSAAAGTALVAAATGGVAGEQASANAGRPLFRGAGGAFAGGQPTFEQPSASKGKEHGKGKGHHKVKHHGKAKGHLKAKRQGRVAFDSPRATKPDHVHPSRGGKHAGRSARAHARAGC